MPATKTLALAALTPLLYLLLCAAIAATLAYPIFLLAGGGEDVRFLRSLVSRGGQVILILGLYGLARGLGFGAASLGFRRDLPRQWAWGFALGVPMLALHALALLALDIRALDTEGFEGSRLLAILAKALGIGILVALIEETLFRGVLFAGLRKYAGTVAAVTVSAFYYAALHFLRSRKTFDFTTIGWDSGFRIAADGFAHMAALPFDSFLALFCAGLLLGCVRAAFPHGLGYCMGLHAGWVFVIKTVKPLTHPLPDTRWSFLVGGYDGFVGYLAAGWIMVVVVMFLARWRFRHGHWALSSLP